MIGSEFQELRNPKFQRTTASLITLHCPNLPIYRFPKLQTDYVRDKDVVRFDIPMDDGFFMKVVDSRGQLIEYFAYFVNFGNLGCDCFVDFGFGGTLLRHIFKYLLF